MPDGPHKNFELDHRWKRFVAASDNDAVEGADLEALAADALLRELMTDDTRALLKDLWEYQNGRQFELDPISSVTGIFSRYPKSAFSETFQKEYLVRLSDQRAPGSAIGEALHASVGDQIMKAKNRMQEQYILARERGTLGEDQFDRMVHRANAAFDQLKERAICDALRRRDKDAFSSAASKRKGLEDGPGL